MKLPRIQLAQPTRVNTPSIQTVIQGDQAQAQAAVQAADALGEWSMRRANVEKVAQYNEGAVYLQGASNNFDKALEENKTVNVDGKDVPIYEQTPTGQTYAADLFQTWSKNVQTRVNEIAKHPEARKELAQKAELFLLQKQAEVDAKARKWFIDGVRARTEESANSLVDSGDYDSAIGVYQSQFDAGLYTGAEFSKIRGELINRRDYMGHFETINKIESHSDIGQAIEGLERPESSLSTAQIESLWSNLYARETKMEKDAEDQKSEAEDAAFEDALDMFSDPMVVSTMSDAIKMKGRVSTSQYKTLLGMASTESQSGVDNIDVVRGINSDIATATDENRAEVAADIRAQMSGVNPVTGESVMPSIKPTTGNTLLQQLNATTEGHFNSRQYRSALSYGQSVITGITELKGGFGFEDKTPNLDEAIRLQNFNAALSEYVAENGADADPLGWSRANIWGYVVSDKDNWPTHGTAIEDNKRILTDKFKRGKIDVATYESRMRIMDKALVSRGLLESNNGK